MDRQGQAPGWGSGVAWRGPFTRGPRSRTMRPPVMTRGDARRARVGAIAVVGVTVVAMLAGHGMTLAANENWPFPIPAFPEPEPKESALSSRNAAPLPPDLAPTNYSDQAPTAAHRAPPEFVLQTEARESAAGSVRPLPPPVKGESWIAPGQEFTTASPGGSDMHFVPSLPASAAEPRWTESFVDVEDVGGIEGTGDIEAGVSGVVDRSFPSSASGGMAEEDSPYRLVAQESPPGPLRRWLTRLAPPDSPELWRSWLEKPISAGMGVGFLHGTALIDDWVQEKAGILGAARLGWDFAPNLGLETRLSFGSMELSDSYAAVVARWASDDAAGLSETDPLRRRFTDRNATTFQWDLSLLYYATDYHPARFYLLWGAGLTRMDFSDRFGESYEGTYFTMPVGFGIKFRRATDPVFRLEFTDNIVFPNRFNVTHHLALTAGLEFRWGGPRRRYWPWTPGY